MNEISPAIDVAVFVLDDLRADHVSSYGYRRKTTPLLDARAAQATRFARCFSPTGWTLPSCASIVTGHMPDEHGLVDHNRRFEKPKLGHFLGEGWERVAFTNNGNTVPDSISPEYIESLGFSRRPAKWRFFGWNEGFDAFHWTHREDHDTPFRLAEAFLSEKQRAVAAGGERKPYFLFFHTNVVHDYHLDRPCYRAVEEWIGRPLSRELQSFPDGPNIWRSPPRGMDLRRMREEIVAKYDAGVRHVDRGLDALLERVDFSRTVVVVVSDHGEGFEPEAGRVHHCGRLHHDLLHVPLFLWLPPGLRARYPMPPVEERTTSTLDIVPTILTMLGHAADGLPGRCLFDLSTHRRLGGSDRGYIYWRDDLVRESYDTCRIEIRSEETFPLKTIRVARNDAVREYAYHLGYDPLERVNLLDSSTRPIANREPITFIVAVNDRNELEENLLASPVARSEQHQWLLVDNADNRRYGSIARLYHEASAGAKHDLVFYLHQDVFLPPGWEERLFLSLEELEREDPRWGVIGAVGAVAMGSQNPDGPKELRGHWCDPHGYHRRGPLPAEVEALDEQWLGVRQSRGPAFDRDLPGFHCYGIDLSLTAREMGLRTYAIDAFVWHKYRDADGHLITRREDSPKIRQRWSESFMAEFNPSADFVDAKWRKYRPFQTTSWEWK